MNGMARSRHYRRRGISSATGSAKASSVNRPLSLARITSVSATLPLLYGRVSSSVGRVVSLVAPSSGLIDGRRPSRARLAPTSRGEQLALSFSLVI
uniref:Uncharacterized protein n=1 Tax=Plectus sambesii TaxID=2011161 RepID=A0A914WJE0_9BILA